MSKNFELLQRVSKDNIFDPPVERVQLPPKAPSSTPLMNAPPERTSPRYPSKNTSPDQEITKLVQRLFSQADEGTGPKVVSFSGMRHDERSGWICARAGEALAVQANKSICMVDANCWSPQLHLYFASANKCGLADALAANGPIRNFVTPVLGGNLFLMSAGFVKPGFHYSMQRCRERFVELRDTFDYILISAPAVSREAEATIFGQLADGVVLVVEANQSRRETVRRVKEGLESAHVRLLGAVLDQRTFPIPEKLYQML